MKRLQDVQHNEQKTDLRIKNLLLSYYYVLFVTFLFLPPSAFGQRVHPDRVDTGKKCAICHFMWVYPFFTEHRDGEIIPQPEKQVVASAEMCFSCHDGSIMDSREMVFHDPGHRAGVIPSERVTIPDDFPLDDQGGLQCSTCHTPHATGGEKKTMLTFFLRAPNNNSSFCELCHLKNTGGKEQGNHPINISQGNIPLPIIEAGGILGNEKPNQIICETCHIPHGGINERFLVLPIEDPTTRSILCEVCHTTKPGLSKDPSLNRFSHPLNILPKDVSSIPKQWSNGESVFLGTGGELVCRTCHKPHDAATRDSLLVDHNEENSLCVQCHTEYTPLIGSSHDLRISDPSEMTVLQKPAHELGPCSSCHLVHEGTRNLMWARSIEVENEDQDMWCTNCHAPGSGAEKVILKNFSHPTGITMADKISLTTLPLFDEEGKRDTQGKLACMTCHDVHNPNPLNKNKQRAGIPPAAFLRKLSDPDPAGICLNCHQQQAMVVGSKHDLRIIDTPYANLLGKTPGEGGVCSACHTAHNAVSSQFLWAAPWLPLHVEDANIEPSSNDNIMTILCTGCHSIENVASSSVPLFEFHPKGLVFPCTKENAVWEQFPLFNNRGERTPDGNIICSTCHNPHQWNASATAETSGTDTEGTILSSFLRQGIDRKLCVACHGEESLFKFLYFHRLNSRKEVSFPQLLRKR